MDDDVRQGPVPEAPPSKSFDPKESNLCLHAERELRDAGWYDNSEDGMYYGMVGPAVQELVEVFARQGHSGGSAGLVLSLFSRVASFGTLTPLKHPMKTGEYIRYDEDGGTLQSTRRSTVFSSDGGKTWYDIDRPKHWAIRWLFKREKRFQSPAFAD